MTLTITLPVCIPDTLIDFTQPSPSRPIDWSAEVAGYYLINQATGSDTNTYGSDTSPRKTIPNPMPAGSLIEIVGDYNHSITAGNYYTLDGRGTEDTFVAGVSGPVWIVRGTNGRFVDNRIIFKGSHIFVTDIPTYLANFQAGSLGSGWTLDSLVIRGCVLSGDSFSGGTLVSVVGSVTDPVSNVIIYNNIMRDNGDMEDTEDQDAHAMAIAGTVGNVWILDNTVHTCSGSGLQVNGAKDITHHIYVGRNHIYNTRQSGLWHKKGSHVVFSSNHIHHVVSTHWSVSKGMGAQYEPDDLWMVNNHIHHCEFGIRVPSTSGTAWDQYVYIIGNVIHDIETEQNISDTTAWTFAAINLISADYIYVYNNIIQNVMNGVNIASGLMTAYLRNNVIMDVTNSQKNGQLGRHIWTELQTINDKIFIENNYFDDTMLVDIKGVEYTTSESLTSIGAVGNINGAQILSDEDLSTIMTTRSIEGFDTSAITDMGVNVDDILLTAFIASYPTTSGVYSDVLGMERVQGAGIDIGSFENGGTFAPAIPTPPVNVLANAGGELLEWSFSSGNEDSVHVYQNGVEIASLPARTQSHPVPNISVSVDLYEVKVVNALGGATSSGIESDIMSVVQLPDTFTEDLSLAKSHLAVRSYVYANNGLLNIGEPSYVGEKFGIPSTDIEFTKDSGSVGNGFNYVLNDTGLISGSVTGTGDCDIITAINSYDGVATSRLQVNSTYVDITCNEGDFDKYKATLNVSGTKDYTLTPITTNAKHATGLVSLQGAV